MAWTTPKIDSIAADGLDYAHLNKIEANISFLAGGNDTIAQSTSAATANALGKRDANADIAFRDILARYIAITPANWTEALAAALGTGWIEALALSRPYITGNTTIYRESGDISTSELVYTEIRFAQSGLFQKSGTVRVDYSLLRTGSAGTAYSQIYVNGSPVGIERSSSTGAGYSENIDIVPGDRISQYMKVSGAGVIATSQYFYVKVGNAV